jgi:hypothetical protein
MSAQLPTRLLRVSPVELMAVLMLSNAVVFATFHQALPVRGFTFFDPGLTQFGVLESFDGGQ